MNIQNISNNQCGFTGIRFYNQSGTGGIKLSSSPFKNNKVIAEIDKELDKIGFDVNLKRDIRGNYSASVIRPRNLIAEVNLVSNRLAQVSDIDERVVRYPISGSDGKRTFEVMYEEIGADAESRAWEYNFGDRLLGMLQAALDIAKKFSRGY